jgi:trimeric autotransporter adhesin
MSTPRRKQVSDAIRILQRKRDASARATHLKAELGMVSRSTIERKIMSTKTSIKRIALVAAAALTLGGFSVISSESAHAAVTADVTGVGISNIAFTSTTAAALTNPGTVGSPVQATVAPGATFYIGAASLANGGTFMETVTAGTDSTYLLTDSTADTGTVAGVSTAVTGGFTYATTAPVKGGTYYYIINTGGVKGYLALTVSKISATVYDGTLGTGLGSTSVNGVAGPANTVTLMAMASTTLRGVVSVSGASSTIASVNGTAQTAGTTSVTLPTGNAADTITVTTPVVGSITVSYYPETAQGSGIYSSTASTVAITVNATGSSGVLSVANSTVYDTITTGQIALANLTATAATGSAAVASSTPVARYDWTANDALKVVMPSTTAYTVTLSGPGSLSATTTTAGARALSGTAGSGTFYLFGDGTSGAATVTVSIGSTVLATKSFTFYSSTVATLSAVVNHAIIASASKTDYVKDTGTALTTTPSAIAVTAKDASGNVIPGSASLLASSSNTSVLTVSAPVWDSTDLVYYVPVTGVAKGSAVVTITNAAGTISTTATLNVAQAVIATWTAAFDNTTYAAGDSAKLLITAKDSDGNLVADGTYNNVLAGAFATSQAVTSTLFGTSLKFVNGVATATFYAPYNAGTLAVSAKGGSSTTVLSTALQLAAATTVLTASANVNAVGGGDASLALDAANAATDAANNAYDEAQNATQAASDALAAVQALAVQVKALIALVTKIKNKVGA